MTNPRVPFRLAGPDHALPPFRNKEILVHLVVNVENWRFDSSMPRKIITAPHGKEAVPDIPNFSWAEYGMRCGMPRLLHAIGTRGLPASCALNAGVIEAYPDLAEAIREAGWCFIGHGLHQKALSAEASEAEVIEEACQRIASFTGQKVRGWLGPGLKETKATPDILKRVGLDYVCDWVIDDAPVWMTTDNGPLVAMPYTLEINDSILHAVQTNPSDEMLTRLIDTIDVYEDEIARGFGPRVLTIGLHPHLMAVPHRIKPFERMLDILVQRSDTTFVTGDDLADWFMQSCSAPNAETA